MDYVMYMYTHLWQCKQCLSPRQDSTGSLNTQGEDKLCRRILQSCIGLHSNRNEMTSPAKHC